MALELLVDEWREARAKAVAGDNASWERLAAAESALAAYETREVISHHYVQPPPSFLPIGNWGAFAIQMAEKIEDGDIVFFRRAPRSLTEPHPAHGKLHSAFARFSVMRGGATIEIGGCDDRSP